METETAERLLAYLEKFEYASRQHVVVALLWHTMLRRGGLRALDLGHYDREEQFLSVVHRPDTGTQLKNGTSGQCPVALSDEVCLLLDDYVLARRYDVTDEYDRKPLVTTSHGRIGASTVSKDCYGWSRPCEFGRGCPHGREPEECEAAGAPDRASKCPLSVGSHAFRRGGITHFLSNDVPEATVSKRANASPDVLERHYDRRSDRDKMEQRRGYLDNV